MSKDVLEMDDVLFLSCHSRFREEEARLSLVAEKRKEAWERLDNAVSHQPIAGNTAVLVTPLPVNLYFRTCILLPGRYDGGFGNQAEKKCMEMAVVWVVGIFVFWLIL
ncbi:hypothetical protein Patl1_02500 [Pistacia atlantica]|uniref:Uncharacterized protein n=1 Tax=Pistacia atlantica TaxID=434234 RepID=A0ACC1C9S8_9ROSI|nr:hypothetical protein Patl1_02500 [Pistacia atlantica]